MGPRTSPGNLRKPAAASDAGGKYFLRLLLILLSPFAALCVFSAQAGAVVNFPATPLPPIDTYVDKPTSVAADKLGRIYVAESVNNRVRIFSQGGNLLASRTGFAKPLSIAVDDASGRIYVGNWNLGNVTVYDAGLQPLFKLGAGDGEFAKPQDIDIDADGNVFVVDNESDAIRIYDSAGVRLWSIDTAGNGNGQLHHPTSLAIDPVAAELIVLDRKQVRDPLNGTMIDGARLQFFSLSGVFLRSYDKFDFDKLGNELAQPQQVTVDDQSRVYVSDSYPTKGLMVYSNTNVFLGRIVDDISPLSTTLGLCLAASGRLYIASFSSGKVNVFGLDSYGAMSVTPPSLTYSATVGEADPLPQSLAITSNGNVPLAWEALTTDSWLVLPVPQSTTSPGGTDIIPVEVTTAGLGTGTHQGTIRIVAPGMEELVTVSLTLGKGTATVTLDGLTQTYDGAPKPVTASTVPEGLTVTLIYDGSPTPPANAGSYAVVATVNDPNFKGSANGTLTINKASAEIVLGNLDQTYDGAAKQATATTVPEGLSVDLTYEGSPTPPFNAGSYGIVATVNDPNYQGTSNSTLTISKANASVVLDGLAQTYDGAAKQATATTIPAGLSVDLTYDGSPTLPVNAGSYGVVATVIDPNYQGFASGTLNITKANAAVTLDDLTQTYDGAPKPVTATTVPEGLNVTFTYDGSPDPPANASSYAVVATVNDPNYKGSANGALTISKASADIVLGDLDQTYDGAAKQATATTVPLGLNIDLTYDGSPTPPVNAGSYTVVATVNDPNYLGSASGTLTIHKANATVTLDNLRHDYDGYPKAATATTVPDGLTVALTYDGLPDPPVPAGTYAVVATVTDPNYSGTASGSLAISAVLPTVTTTGVSAVRPDSAQSGGEVTFDGGAAVTGRGICWNTTGAPSATGADSCTLDGSGSGPFVSLMDGLTAHTIYFVRAYAANSAGTAYGNEITFTTVATWTLRIAKEGKGSGTVTSTPAGIDCGEACSQLYEDGQEINLTPTPAPGSKFTGWSGDNDCEDGKVTMSKDLSCTAHFYHFPWPLFLPAFQVAPPAP